MRVVLVSDVENLISLNDADAEHFEDCKSDLSSADEKMEDSDSGEEDEEDAPTAEKMAACALCVSVGSFSDPPDIPGLAHFLEHMVFMGSEKFPAENALDDFLKKRGGNNNAMTDFEYTTFHIECREAHLLSGMDLFSHFFISPLLLKGAMARERQAIDSEFELALPSDGSRFEQLLGSLFPLAHPARCFPWGNKVTLEDQVEDNYLHETVGKFRERHYSANRMTLAVVARLPLDTLEKYVTDTFADVPNNELPPLDLSPFRGKPPGSDFNSLLYVKPVHSLNEVCLTWILPPMGQHYEANPLSYLSSLLGHEGDGSLHVYLKDKVLGLKTLAGNDGSGFEDNSLFSVFSVTVELTDAGLDRVDEVIKAVFSYLAMLRRSIPNQRIYEELKDIRLANFKYKDEVDAAKLAEFLAEGMHVYKPEHYLAGSDLYLEYNPQLIKSALDELRYDNVNVAIHCMEKPDEFYTQVEPWFQTKFTKEEIPDGWRTSWRDAPPLPEFFLPAPNQYITRRFSLLETNEVNHPEYPEKILQDPLVEVWYRFDRKFNKPGALYWMFMRSPVAYSNARNCTLLDILSTFLELKLGKILYPADEAGFSWGIKSSDFGLVLNVDGFDEKINIVYEEILKGMKNVLLELKELKPADAELFEAIKKEKARGYFNCVCTAENLNHGLRLKLLMENHYWAVERKNELVAGINFDELAQFYQQFLSHVYCQALVQGNVDRATALSVAELLKNKLSMKDGEKPSAHRVTNLKEGLDTLVLVQGIGNEDSNAVVTNYYQSGPRGESLRVACIIDLVMLLMEEPLFDNLRTQRQIGYDISCQVRNTLGVIGFTVTVNFQNNKFTAEHVDQEIENFLTEFSKQLHDLLPKDLQEAKDSLSALKKIVDNNLKEEVTRNWEEIISLDYMFDRLPREVETIQSITHSEICTWFDSQIKSSATRKKLSIQVVANYASPPQPDGKVEISAVCPDPNLYVSDLNKYFNERNFYPPLKKLGS